ncbi:TlpA family protein disulfide reductase [Flavilitoribacter nigricans]|nr:TlpA disulfide reductase family protein [Flavilitoribacter nigricans]
MKYLLCAFLLLWGFYLSAQNVEPYFLAIVEAEPSDGAFNDTIDTYWSNTMALDKDTTLIAARQRTQYASALYEYYQNHRGTSTGEKAALHQLFILLRMEAYEEIQSVFTTNNFSANLWIASYPLYKRAVLKTSTDSRVALNERLTNFLENTSDKTIAAFITHQLELQIGDAAPAIPPTDLYDRALDTKGKVVLIDFWATWCLPCLKNMPEMRAIYEEFSENDDFVFLAVSRDDDPEQLQQYLQQHDLPWMHIRDGLRIGGELAYEFRVQEIPKHIIIDQKGIVRYNSSVEDNRELLLATIRKLLE